MQTVEGHIVTAFLEFVESHGDHQLSPALESQALGPDGRMKTACHKVPGREDGVAFPVDCLTCSSRYYVFTPFALMPKGAVTRPS